MRNAILVSFLLAPLLLLLPSPALAQDAPAEEAPSKVGEASAPAPDPEPPAVRGEKVEIRLRSGVVLTGILKGSRAEVMRGTSYVAVESSEAPGAGIRIFYALGLDGFVFIPYVSVDTIEFPGEMSEAEGKALARVMRDDRRKAERDRERAIEEIAAKKAAIAAALRGEDEVEEVAPEELAPRTLPEAPPPEEPEPSPEEVARAAEKARLLLRFPPTEWTPARFLDLKRRAVQEDIFPDEEEREFVRNYALWLEAYREWEEGK